uniref:Uncharacterized protein n=1 Tax=Mycena chlorophos TaxID=658473 RepID=A0ABQ0LNJ4_MYCCL|nr:predicted protein [Mycena chlorophos]
MATGATVCRHSRLDACVGEPSSVVDIVRRFGARDGESASEDRQSLHPPTYTNGSALAFAIPFIFTSRIRGVVSAARPARCKLRCWLSAPLADNLDHLSFVLRNLR